MVSFVLEVLSLIDRVQFSEKDADVMEASIETVVVDTAQYLKQVVTNLHKRSVQKLTMISLFLCTT